MDCIVFSQGNIKRPFFIFANNEFSNISLELLVFECKRASLLLVLPYLNDCILFVFIRDLKTRFVLISANKWRLS